VRLNATACVQYNSLDDRWITSLRLHFIHRPGSDLYLVFNDDQGEEGAPGRLVSRGFAVRRPGSSGPWERRRTRSRTSSASNSSTNR
jgi:hypothetical protein